MRSLCALLASLTFGTGLFGAEPVRLDAPGMQALVAEALSSWEVPGVAIAVVNKDNVLWLHGHGIQDIDTGQRLSHETLFPLASCSKAFTSALIASLVADGTMSWDEPVAKHLPGFVLADPLASASVSIRDLLCHRTGLASHDYLWYRSPWSLAEQVRRAGLLPLERPFRTAFQYQSVMVTAAGLAAARAGGDNWDALVRKRLFEPLEMTTASCVSPPASADRASPHKMGADGKLHVMPWYEQQMPNPAGSIHASAKDLVGWLQFQLGNGQFRGRQLIAPAAFREMHVPQMALRIEGIHRAMNPATLLMSYGLGWVIQDYRGVRLVYHAGAIDGFRAHITLLPDAGLGFALLSNRHQSRINMALSNTLVDRLMGLPPRDWNGYFKGVVAKEAEAAAEKKARRNELRRPDDKPGLPPAQFAGTYEHKAYGVARVGWNGTELRWEWNGIRGPMRHFAGNEYEIQDENLTDSGVVFKIENGRVTGLDFLNLRFARR